jgi:hypothetical protein
MSDQKSKAEQFRALHVPGKPFVLFNIWDPGSAKAVTAAGAKAIATGSWSVANANGFADGEHIPLGFAIDNLRRIVDATCLPVSIDLESGYGDTPQLVGETIGRAIDAGAIGCNLEEERNLRAVDWADNENRMHHLLRLHYGEDGYTFEPARNQSAFTSALRAATLEKTCQVFFSIISPELKPGGSRSWIHASFS